MKYFELNTACGADTSDPASLSSDTGQGHWGRDQGLVYELILGERKGVVLAFGIFLGLIFSTTSSVKSYILNFLFNTK